MAKLRRNPPSEDFNEVKLKLQWADARIVNLIEENTRLKITIEHQVGVIADIQDDTEGEIHGTS